jgi:hypothetical protein
MEININRVIFKKRIGISIQKTKFKTIKGMEKALKLIKQESKRSSIGTRARAILDFNFDEKKTSYYLSAFIDVPIKFKDYQYHYGKWEIKEKIIYYTKNIEAILNIQNGLIYFFSQGQKEIQQLKKFLRRITENELMIVPIKINNEGLKEILNNLKEIYHVKLFKNNSTTTSKPPSDYAITIRGQNFKKEKSISDLLNNESMILIEVGGLGNYSNMECQMYLNIHGRISLVINNIEKSLFLINEIINKLNSFIIK